MDYAYLKMRVEKNLATATCRAIEEKKITVTAALAYSLAAWLDANKEPELAAMILDGRGLVPRQPLRHRPLQTGRKEHLNRNPGGLTQANDKSSTP